MSLKQESKLPKDHELAKAAQSMTAGVTPNKLELGATIDLHGHPVTITHTDDADTMVQYANKARRTFDTHVLNSYLDLKTFPVGAAFERPTAPVERAVIEAVTGDCCYQVRVTIGSEEPFHLTFTYADFVAWHMENSSRAGETRVSAIPTSLIDSPADDQPEADEPDENANPFEEDLQKRIEQLTAENFGLKTLIHSQKLEHDTVIAGYEEDIKRLEAKAAILNPAPTRKEVCTLIQPLNNPIGIREADVELATKLNDGWTVLHMEVTTIFWQQESIDGHTRIATLVRDLPADQPKASLPVQAINPLHIGAVPLTPRLPVQQPPMPVNQTIIHQPVSRALTHNGPKPGETKRIPTLADIQARHQRHDDEIAEIAQRGRDTQETIRQRFANTPRPFSMTSGI